jgi:hypothetical protein
MGYLRAFVTLLVVAHHAVLAYLEFLPLPTAGSLVVEPRLWLAFPVIDTQRWPGFSLFAGFNDTYFMALLFFVAGLFTWPSLARKGVGRYLKERSARLGIPFAIGAAVVAPIAYSAAYVMRTPEPTVEGFWRQWLGLGIWPAGPAWFLWVLLAFSAAAAAAFAVRGGRLPVPYERLARLGSRPFVCFALLALASAALYVPLALAFTPIAWATFGPFTVQTSRVLHYALYFAAGVAIGGARPEAGLLAPAGPLSRRWIWWVAAAGVAGLVAMAVMVAAIGRPQEPYFWGVLGGCAFAVSCAASSFAMAAVFLRFARRRVRILDSLRANAYGIYLFHYPVVAWMQYGLLDAAMPAYAKGAVVFTGATAITWAMTAALRRVAAIERVL